SRTHGRKVRAQSAGGNRGKQEELSGAVDLCAWNPVCGGAHRATTSGTLFFVGGIGSSEGRRFDTGVGSRTEGGGEYRGVFLGASKPTTHQEIVKGWRSADGREAQGQERQVSREVVRVYGCAGESNARRSGRDRATTRGKSIGLGEQENGLRCGGDGS